MTEAASSSRQPVRTTEPGLPDRIPGLDGLRGIAVLLVLVNNLYPGYPDRFADGIMYLVSNTGWMGVDLFFVLSGFLITGILLDAKGDRHYFRNFYARRFLRIFPLYYGFLALWVLVVAVAPGLPVDRVDSFLSNQGWYWSYLANFKIAHAGWGLGLEPAGFWSLAVEEQFYLIWPLVVFWTTRRRLAGLGLALVLGALATRVVWLTLDSSKLAHEAVYVSTVTRMDNLALGALLAVGVRSPNGLAFLRRIAPRAALAGTVVLAGLFVWLKGLPAANTVVQTLGYTVIGFSAAGYLVVAATGAPGSIAQRVFAHPALRFFGKYSYGIYVWQIPLRPLFWEQAWIKDPPRLAGFQFPSALVILTGISALATGLAFVSYHLYEKHFLRLKRLFPTRTA